MCIRTDLARCQNSMCWKRSYFCVSALRYNICLQLSPYMQQHCLSSICLELPLWHVWTKYALFWLRQGKGQLCWQREKQRFSKSFFYHICTSVRMGRKVGHMLDSYQQCFTGNPSVVEYHASEIHKMNLLKKFEWSCRDKSRGQSSENKWSTIFW